MFHKHRFFYYLALLFEQKTFRAALFEKITILER